MSNIEIFVVVLLSVVFIAAIATIICLLNKCDDYMRLWEQECRRNELREKEIDQKFSETVAKVRAEYERNTPRIL